MKLRNKKILLFVEEMYEDLELHYPRFRMIEEGAEVVIAGPKKQLYKGKHGYPCEPNVLTSDIREEDFDVLIIPGGYAPDKLRKDKYVLELTKKFFEKGKPLAFICHAGWVPISAKIVKGLKCTSVISIKDDMVNAGAHWIDERVVVDKNVVTAQEVKDLPGFCQALIIVESAQNCSVLPARKPCD